jgi:hypothetical protein
VYSIVALVGAATAVRISKKKHPGSWGAGSRSERWGVPTSSKGDVTVTTHDRRTTTPQSSSERVLGLGIGSLSDYLSIRGIRALIDLGGRHGVSCVVAAKKFLEELHSVKEVGCL